mgnify:CR=1 FL=1
MPIRHLGYCCINMTLSENLPKAKQVLTSRTLRQATFSLEKVSALILDNVRDLYTILQWNKQHDIYLFRISSEIFPFMDHPTLGYKLEDLSHCDSIKSILKNCGDFAKQHGIRLTSHPGPYNCLGSPNSDTILKTILSLNMHALLGELLGVDFNINIHVGGSYDGDFIGTAKRFNDNYAKLSDSAKKWLTVENDDKASMWDINNLYELIHKQIGIPIVMDLHHWNFCNRGDIKADFQMAMDTWQSNTIPKIHYSESRNSANSNIVDKCKPQAHSDFILNIVPDYSDRLYDCMFECKAKDKALLLYRAKLLNAA